MDLTPINIGIVGAVLTGLAGYVAYILVPACASYTRVWERFAAGFLTLFILVSLLGVGLTIGLSIVWFYDSYS